MPALVPLFLTALTAAQLMAASPVLAAAEKPPAFNVEPSCRSAVAASISPGRDLDSCMRDEQNAQTKLDQTWNSFSAKERSDCMRLSLLDGQPSYVEVLTCLEIAAEAKKDSATTGFGGGR